MPEVAGLTDRAAAVAGADIAAAVAWAVGEGGSISLPGSGATRRRWDSLARVAAVDVTLARVLEPHVDALAILAEAGMQPPPGSSWGVYAAEGPGVRVDATPTSGGAATLSGRKPWCSLGGVLSHALVTAWVDEERRGLFAVDLGHAGVRLGEETWSPVGLSAVTTTALDLDDVPAHPVGGPGWYLDRDGFAWGGLGVAAVWWGGAVGVARRLLAQAERRAPDQVALMHLGAVDAVLAGADAALARAAHDIDTGRAAGPAGALLAARTRHVVAEAAEQVLLRVGHALGPGPLSLEGDHARRTADLALYLRQHHAERDSAALGRLVLDDTAARWW